MTWLPLLLLHPVIGAEWAATPPRGWNSYDSYTWKVSEAAFLANCASVARTLRPFGWDLCVVDYLWFQDLDEAPVAEGVGDPITTLHIDAHGRLQPAPDRWPSAAGGKGFKAVADRVHALGMRFGIHVMRGISTAAVAAKSPIFGTSSTADAIALEADLCPWWKGVMSVNLSNPAGQAYYDSVYAQYSEWGVDFVCVPRLLTARGGLTPSRRRKNDCVFGNQFAKARPCTPAPRLALADA